MPQLSNSVMVAAIQAAPVSFDLPKSLQKVAEFTSRAAAAGADLVVFPFVLAPRSLRHLAANGVQGGIPVCISMEVCL